MTAETPAAVHDADPGRKRAAFLPGWNFDEKGRVSGEARGHVRFRAGLEDYNVSLSIVLSVC
jgi:hypothetical protein